MKYLLGETGLIGRSLKEQTTFDGGFSSKNLDDVLNIPDGQEIFLSCLPATKWQVNQNLQADLDNMQRVINVLKQKKFSRVNLISTIDVYCNSQECSDESHSPRFNSLSYGHNRYLFELMVRAFVSADELKIFRLPALYNKHIKKNVLYDLLHNKNVEKISYHSAFQWYNLDYLYDDIIRLTRRFPEADLFNIFPEPLYTQNIIELFPDAMEKVDFVNAGSFYNYHTKYTSTGYFYPSEQSLQEIKKLIYEARTN